jgi:hypothetical protein
MATPVSARRVIALQPKCRDRASTASPRKGASEARTRPGLVDETTIAWCEVPFGSASGSAAIPTAARDMAAIGSPGLGYASVSIRTSRPSTFTW